MAAFQTMILQFQSENVWHPGLKSDKYHNQQICHIDRKSRHHQCSSESQELSTQYFRLSSVVCSLRVIMCSLCGVSVTWGQKLVVDQGRVCLPLSLFSNGFSLAIHMASAMPSRNQSFSLHLTLLQGQNCDCGHPYVHQSGNSYSDVLWVVYPVGALSLRCSLPGKFAVKKFT